MPARDGVDATRVVLDPARWSSPTTVGEALLAAPTLTGVTDADLAAQCAAGAVVDESGHPVDLDAPVVRPRSVYLYRDLPDEVEVPFDLPILYRDERIVVVDKPHFLATMPRGRHVTQTALVRLRRELGDDDVAPAHRLDRLTAGVLLFTRRRADRSAYQRLFADREVRKEYRAAAPLLEPVERSPIRIENRIEKTSGDLRARIVDGPVNAISDITLTGMRDDGTAEYLLVPHTGRTHQLRLHLSSLGAPIVGDPLYPEVDDHLASASDRGDYSTPLRLVASALEFTDPFTGARRRFESDRPV
ncbi:MAG: pseudouridine synthase [Gordonia sp. (in: high G+C Gram-positive bacteria)]|uniref:pseudouridine synthase n=1 Tax=Gordonia sp. (in: high G+C Gram-positive bacteria) TaxID=84139 RepID=UPI0039E70C99